MGATELSTELMDNLLKYPDVINKIELDILHLNSEIERINEKIKPIEMNYEIEVLNEKDDSGKPLHSNLEKRNIAFQKLVNFDSKLKKMYQDKADNEIQIQSKKINLKYYYNLQSNSKAVLKYLSK